MDDYPLLDLFLTMLFFFLWIMWLFLLFRVVMDVFRDEELSGWAKAGWLIFCIVLPYLGVLVYVIVRGRGMGQRDVDRSRKAEAAFQDYIRKTAADGQQSGSSGSNGASGSSGTDELVRLAQLHDSGALTDDEFAQAKTKLLA
ncbi:SHOCT domain-containing protein [Streptomyces kanamyceticus]|uniref:SHOCT domain-containing protein n=1 Tax=Streptomyces kanamyceticus TaxID=1967 RepID=A0A5J6G6X2_STRKN|nr:SHOCT domain-containing protein [Streptomyces kanamyceticus]QEU89698.1 SHOCT domain-containing protein [Streptomyces kanamyceticus]